MKKLILAFLFFTLVPPVFAQKTQQQKIDSVAKLVVQYWNEKNADKIYNMAGTAFREELPEATFRQIATTNLFPAGAITESRFIGHRNGVSKYLVVTPADKLQMLISLDSSDKLQMFYFPPYKEEIVKRTRRLLSDNPLKTAMDRQVDSVMQNFFADSLTAGGSLGILKDGKTYFYNYGETRKGNNALPSSRSLYEIGSISKTFTGVLLAFAVNEGKLKLSDPVNKYLPANIPALQRNGKAVTVAMLSNHSSGIARLPIGMFGYNPLNPYKTYGNEQMMADLLKLQPESDPGSRYSYSNFAVGILGVILENLYKKSYDELVREKIAVPLKMNMTGQYTDKKFPAQFTQGHNEAGKPTPHWEFGSLAAAGALISNTEDMLKYAAANIATNNKKLDNAIRLAQQPTFISDSTHAISDGVESIGLGWHIASLNGKKFHTHSGGTGGFRTFLGVVPDAKLAVVFLTNQATDAQAPAMILVNKLLKD